MKSNDDQASALAIRNVGLLYQAQKLLEVIQDDVYQAVKDVMERLLLGSEWVCYLEDDYFWIKEWSDSDDPEDAYAFFTIWAESPKGDDDGYLVKHLTRLCGHGPGQVGISWEIEYKKFNKNKSWQNEIAGKTAGDVSGFKYDQKAGFWFLPITIDVDKLADGYASSAIEDAVSPRLEEVVKEIERSLPVFKKILNEASAGQTVISSKTSGAQK